MTGNLFDQPPLRPTIVDRHATQMRDRDLGRKKERLGPPKAERTIQERFLEFHAKNPHVYRELCAIARKLKARGHARYGMPAVYEIARYESIMTESNQMEAGSVKQIKLPNNYRSRYSELIMEREQDLRGFFRTAQRRTP